MSRYCYAETPNAGFTGPARDPAYLTGRLRVLWGKREFGALERSSGIGPRLPHAVEDNRNCLDGIALTYADRKYTGITQVGRCATPIKDPGGLKSTRSWDCFDIFGFVLGAAFRPKLCGYHAGRLCALDDGEVGEEQGIILATTNA